MASLRGLFLFWGLWLDFPIITPDVTPDAAAQRWAIPPVDLDE